LAKTARGIATRTLTLALISSTLSIITPQVANAETVVATGSNASFCDQAVDKVDGVSAERLANGDCLVKFSSTSTTINWTVPLGVTAADVLVVGGGGGGGTGRGGGGGGGGVAFASNLSVTAGAAYGINIGEGGAGGTSGGARGTSGGNSSFVRNSDSATVVIAGGGGGGGTPNPANPTVVLNNDGGGGNSVSVSVLGGVAVGGNGGGSAFSYEFGGVRYFSRGGNGGTGTTARGKNGGANYYCPAQSAANESFNFRRTTGGGAGAGRDGYGHGTTSPEIDFDCINWSDSFKPNGGDGLSNSITGSDVTYGAGGGGSDGHGSTETGNNCAVQICSLGRGTGGGTGGAGESFYESSVSVTLAAVNGLDGRGEGGGGGVTTAARGGSGVVIVSYVPANVATLSALNLSSGTLAPTFASNVINYTASVANAISSGYTVTPTKTDSNATTVQYIGATGTTDFAGALNVGENIIRIVVTAKNDATTSTYTVTVTRAATKPDAPESVTATSNGNGKSVISWSAPASDGGSTINGYTVTASGGQSCSTETATATTCTVTGLLNKTLYSFTVTATNEIGTSESSTAAYAATGSVSTTFTRAGTPITTSAFEGGQLSIDVTNLPSGSYTYKWFRGSETATITSGSLLSTSATYTPSASDRSLTTQMYIAVQVVAAIDGNNYTFTSTAVPVYTYPNATGGSVTAPTPAARGTYTSGRYKVGQTVIGHAWSVMGTPLPTLNYQWWICNTSGLTSNPQAAAALATPTCEMATGAGNSGVATRGGYASSPTSIQSTNPNDLGNYGFSFVVPEVAAGKFLTFTATLSNAATVAQSNTSFTFTQSRTMNSGIIQTTPVITGTPNITGINSVGKRLISSTVSAITNNGNASGKISYQWQRCEAAASGCSNIPGATRTTYTPINDDLAKYLRVVATATNSATTPDSTTATSASVVINPAYSVPSGMSVSLDSPSSTKGATLSAIITGTTGYPASYTYTYQWQRCTSAVSTCSNIGSANSPTYVTTGSDSTKHIRLAIRATNSAGTSSWVYSKD
jgi:hypothetical protein